MELFDLIILLSLIVIFFITIRNIVLNLDISFNDGHCKICDKKNKNKKQK